MIEVVHLKIARPSKFQLNYVALLMLVLFSPCFSSAQDDLLMAELSKSIPKEREFVYATFKGTRGVDLQTVETLGKKAREFRIAHRFGDFSSGANNLWGLDGPATIQFHYDFGITDRLTVGIGRASLHKAFDVFGKYNLLKQTTDNAVPVTLTLLGSTNYISEKDHNQIRTGVDEYQHKSNRVAYVTSILIARKINSKLSLQLNPMFIHYNLAYNYGDKNDVLAIGFLSRYKISSHVAFTGEYIYRLNNQSSGFDFYHNALSLGLDLETGGHVFQVFFTNSFAINEISVVPYTESDWTKGQFRLGFNISRVFSKRKHSTS